MALKIRGQTYFEGAYVSNVKVRLYNRATKALVDSTTSSSPYGEFEFTVSSVGPYFIVCIYDTGYNAQIWDNVSPRDI